MTHYVFENVTFRAEKSLACPLCGRKVRRARTFGATINPWNVNADGEPRRRDEIRALLRENAAAWQAEPVVCSALHRLETG
jgi:hypothetical protein